MKKWMLTYVLLIPFLIAFSQENGSFIQDDKSEEVQQKFDKRVFTQVGLGSSVMYNSQGHYSFSTYLHPQISYQMTPRFTVSMGLMAVCSNINSGMFYNYEGVADNVDYNGLSAYYTLQGSYLLSEKLRVYSGVMLGKQSVSEQLEGKISKMNPKAYMLGIEYNIGEHCSLQLEFQYREDNAVNPFYDNRRTRELNSPFMESNFFPY